MIVNLFGMHVKLDKNSLNIKKLKNVLLLLFSYLPIFYTYLLANYLFVFSSCLFFKSFLEEIALLEIRQPLHIYFNIALLIIKNIYTGTIYI